ncbi:hypothetical protein GJAV_G00248000 [Gymnothorax javanicus]|nr:hypothetical protein GJAV_G00248000 [Gymnothorax javanicus]
MRRPRSPTGASCQRLFFMLVLLKVSNEVFGGPNVISNLTVTHVTSSSVSLSWTAPEGESSFYRVEWDESAGLMNRTTDQTSVNITGLTAGAKYMFRVYALAAENQTEGDSVNKTQYTRPNVVSNLTVTLITSSSVSLSWTAPEGESSFYRVEWDESTGLMNEITDQTSVNISGLTAGAKYMFRVYARAADNQTEGDSVNKTQYTTLERPANVNAVGDVRTMNVTWDSSVEGNVSFTVTIYNNSAVLIDQKNVTSVQLVVFSNLKPGHLYGVEVTIYKESLNATSEMRRNATYPTPPGAIIKVEEQTTSSIKISWDRPLDMDLDQYNFSVLINGSQFTTAKHSANLSDLVSGTQYKISVTTVGPLGYQSTPVRITVYTRPKSVQSLEVNSTSEDKITIQWEANSHRYKVVTTNYTSETNQTHYQVINLTPGTQYNISVTPLAFDGTEGMKKNVSGCTDAAQVANVSCIGPNLTDAVLMLSWSKPRGANRGFKIQLDDQDQKCSSVCSYNWTHLLYDTNYTVKIQTLSCGKPSSFTETVCKTGITVPPVPDTADVSITGKDHNTFTLQLNPKLFNNISGPIKGYGVLVTDKEDLSGGKTLFQSYLNKTYENWTAGHTSAYLAVLKIMESRSHNGGNSSVVVIGDGSKSCSYRNGPLKSSKTYRFAVVTFTNLEISNELVAIPRSFFSISQLNNEGITIPVNSVVVGGAVGGAVAALVILVLATVILVAVWKRLSERNSSEVPIYSIRSSPIRVENYEAYYKENQADSNFGFADQYETLKPVGVAQARNIALAPENKGKNRYNNVLPYDSSRVKLSVQGSPHDDYINANYMPGYSSKKEFIAAQGPLPSTVNEFWRMVWEKNVHTLVMLTKCNEQGRVKCEKYWPSGTQHYSNITVTTATEIPLEDWTIRDFSLKNVKTAETRTVRHFHFTAWPDHGVPETTELLINFRHLVREHMDEYSCHSPTVVHCSAGVGRTGTFIAIDRLIYQIERDGVVDVYGIVHDLRMHRPLMVQTEDQFVFLNQCAMDIIRSRTGTNVDLIYQNTAALSIYENIEPRKSSNGIYNA